MSRRPRGVRRAAPRCAAPLPTVHHIWSDGSSVLRPRRPPELLEPEASPARGLSGRTSRSLGPSVGRRSAVGAPLRVPAWSPPHRNQTQIRRPVLGGRSPRTPDLPSRLALEDTRTPHGLVVREEVGSVLAYSAFSVCSRFKFRLYCLSHGTECQVPRRQRGARGTSVGSHPLKSFRWARRIHPCLAHLSLPRPLRGDRWSTPRGAVPCRYDRRPFRAASRPQQWRALHVVLRG